jgi:hypothetical protein
VAWPLELGSPDGSWPGKQHYYLAGPMARSERATVEVHGRLRILVLRLVERLSAMAGVW